MQVENIPLVNLKYDEFNARTHGDLNLKSIRSSLERYGQVEPLVIQKSTNMVIGGNGRLEAMLALGWKTADVVILDLNDAQARDLGLRLNRTAELAEWDIDQLKENLTFLASDEVNFNIEEIGYTDIDIENIFNDTIDSKGVEDNELILTDEIRKKLFKAAIRASKENIEIIDRCLDQGIPLQSKANAIHQFILAKHLNKKYLRYNSLAFSPQQFKTSGNERSLYDLFKLITDNKIEILSDVVLMEGLTFNIVKAGSLPIKGSRLPLDFPANLCRDLIQEFKAEKMLDPCHGWGGRFIGFLMSDCCKEYFGVDPSPVANTALIDIAETLSEYSDSDKTWNFINECFEKIEVKKSYYDFALTSPPYFNVEKYTGENQSHVLYKNYDEWRDNFYFKLIEKTFSALKEGGVFCLQIGSQSYPLLKDAKSIAYSVGFVAVETRETIIRGNKTEVEQREVVLVLKKLRRAQT